MGKKMAKKVKIETSLSKVELKRLQDLAKRNKVPFEEVMQKFNETKETIKSDRLAVTSVMNSYRRTKSFQQVAGKKSNIVTLYGFIIGDMGLFDKADQMRNKVKGYINKNGIQAAVEAQLINESNEILDQRQQIYGRDNPNYLEPLSPELHLRSRTLLMIARKNGDKEFKRGTIHTEDNRLAKGWEKVKFYTPCQVPVNLKEESDKDFKANSSSAEETTSVFKAIKEDMDIDKIIKEVTEKELTAIEGVEKFHEDFKDAWDRSIVIKGAVAWVSIDRPTPFGSVWMQIMDPDNEENAVRCMIPSHLSIDFGEGSEVIVFGKTRVSKYKDQESGKLVDGDVIIDVHGIYPIPGLTTPKEVSIPETLADETEVNGWLE
jgi:hypothetical protein